MQHKTAFSTDVSSAAQATAKSKALPRIGCRKSHATKRNAKTAFLSALQIRGGAVPTLSNPQLDNRQPDDSKPLIQNWIRLSKKRNSTLAMHNPAQPITGYPAPKASKKQAPTN
jgi:hypothetical protein